MAPDKRSKTPRWVWISGLAGLLLLLLIVIKHLTGGGFHHHHA